MLCRNLGDGTFADVVESVGIVNPLIRGGEGAVWGDYDNDGDLDSTLETWINRQQKGTIPAASGGVTS